MKKQIQLLALLFVVAAVSPAAGQFDKNSSFKEKVNPQNKPAMVKIWSDWISPTENTDKLKVCYSTIAEPGKLKLMIKNIGKNSFEADFTANECSDDQKNISGWQLVKLASGASVTLTFGTGGCGQGFHWWYKNFFEPGVWSNWEEAGYPFLKICFTKYSRNEISVRVANNGNAELEGEFTANECDENQKDVAGWQKLVLPPGDDRTLNFKTGGCGGSIRTWYRNVTAWTDWESAKAVIQVPVEGKLYSRDEEIWLYACIVKRGNEIVMKVRNESGFFCRAEFTANYCRKFEKSVNGWKQADLPPNETVFLRFNDRSADCGGSTILGEWHWWFRNFRQL